ncbi:hypothetical protein [Rhodovulum marinum]|uniref:hypothetical protein n=1 Tax=Rhodovulum marinum TaxID=320662 RepID=UPI00104E6829|nr:hypothetical protein [Rhodovulum marinum]
MTKTRKARPGFHKVPRELLDEHELSSEARFLLIYLSSHDPAWVLRIEDVCRHLGWGRARYKKYRKELVLGGYLETTRVRGPNSDTGKQEIVGFRVRTDFSPLRAKKQPLETADIRGCRGRFSTGSNSTPLSRESSKGEPPPSRGPDWPVDHPEVIEDADAHRSSAKVISLWPP